MTMEDGRSVIGRILSPSFKKYGAGACPDDSMEAEVSDASIFSGYTHLLLLDSCDEICEDPYFYSSP